MHAMLLLLLHDVMHINRSLVFGLVCRRVAKQTLILVSLAKF